MSRADLAAQTEEPVSAAEFLEAAHREGLAPPLAVAVSGGGDSMALLAMVARWAEHQVMASGPGLARDKIAPVTALTVDHGIRPESAQEAHWVGEQAARFGIPHVVLSAPDIKLSPSNLQAEARDLRYRLMERWCRKMGVPTLLTAHTLDDQAETFLMRLARGSGVDGLAAMASRTVLYDAAHRPTIELVRPLLHMPRERLRATLDQVGLSWLEDPSNEDQRFARVRFRRLAALLAEEGLTADRLAVTAERMARARAALEDYQARLVRDCVFWHRAGFARLETGAFVRAPEDVALRVLAGVIRSVGGQTFPPRFDRLERIFAAVRSGTLHRGRTLGGCRIVPVAGGEALQIARENRHLESASTLDSGSVRLWDGRFRVSLPRGQDAGEIRPLGRDGYSLMRDAGASPPRDMPVGVRPTLPAFWRGERLVAVPHAGFDPLRTGFRATFVSRLLGVDSHLDAFEGGAA